MFTPRNPLLTEIPMSTLQVVAITRLMLHIAHVDGARSAEEVALISQFYTACRSENADLPEFESIAAEQGVDHLAASDFPDAAHRDIIIALCLMVAYADGELSQAEQAAIAQVSVHLALSEEHTAEILAQVKDTMLAQLAHLPDAASVAVVAKELG